MPYKKVIAFGDSFTRGDELTDCPDEPSLFSTSTWPALLAKKLNIDYDCIAIGGKGNHWISWMVAKDLHKLKDVLCIINWTWFERFDYITNDTVNTDWVQWRTTHPRHEDKLNHYFYKHIDSEYWNLHRNLQQLHSTIALLKQNKINFLMTCLDPLLHTKIQGDSLYDKDWQDVTTNLQEHILYEIINFYGYTFLDWSKHKNFPLGANGHPLEKAHVEAAKYINTHTIEGKNNGHR